MLPIFTQIEAISGPWIKEPSRYSWFISWIHIKVINQFNTYTLAPFYNVVSVLQHPNSPMKMSPLENSPHFRYSLNNRRFHQNDYCSWTWTFKTYRKMTIVIIQYFPKIVECRVAFSSNGSKYRHPIFSYSLHWKNVPFQWGSTNWPIGSEKLGKSVARRCTVVYICNTPHLISRFNTFTQNQETNPPLSCAGQRLIFLNCQLQTYSMSHTVYFFVRVYESLFMTHNFMILNIPMKSSTTKGFFSSLKFSSEFA